MLRRKLTIFCYLMLISLIYLIATGRSISISLYDVEATNDNKVLTREEIDADISQFLSNLRALHPYAENFVSTELIERKFQQLRREVCPDTCTIRELKKITLKIIHFIGTDHLFLRGFKRSLPFELHKASQNEFKLLLDSGEILRNIKHLNGMPVEHVWFELEELTPRLNANLEDSYISAHSKHLLPLLLDSNAIEVTTTSTKHTFLASKANSSSSILMSENDDFLYVKISSMSKLDPQMLFNEFNKLSKQHLVLDLSGNRGGSVAKTAKLFEFLTTRHGFKHISPHENRLIKLSKELTELNRSSSPFWFLTSAFLECGFKDAYFYKEVKPKLSAICENVETRTRVTKIQTLPQIYIVIDGGTASSAAIFAGQMKRTGKARVFGSVAYGNALRNYGNSKLITLNYSQLVVGIPTTYTYRDASADIWPTSHYHGVSPHTHCLKSACLELVNEEIYKSSVDL